MDKNFMELLSPAGSPAAALAAFDAGADAVYAGLSKFNARERGENFTPDMMKRIVDYAHSNQRKVYLTLNTLIREAELPELMEILRALPQWDAQSISDAINNYAAAKEIKAGRPMWQVRIAVSGCAVTPGGPGEIMEILGREESLRRIGNALAKLG